MPTKNVHEPLVNLADFDFVLEPAYFQQGLTENPHMFLRSEAAKRLAAVQTELYPFKFKIWDAFRPENVQRALYQQIWEQKRVEHPEFTPEELNLEVNRYVADPDDIDFIPPHLTGGTVDITLVDEDGKELDMGCAIDECSEQAQTDYFKDQRTNHVARANRRLLGRAMREAGFVGYADEWWHFEYGTQLWAATLGKPCAIYGSVAE